MQTVKFRLVYENFQPGDVAKFPEDEAFELHEAGFAEFVEDTKSIYADLSVKELDALLEDRTLEAGGKKGEKIARLEVDDDLAEDESDSEDNTEENQE